MPHSLQLADARRIVTDPETAAQASHDLRVMAWAALKGARHQRCIQHRLKAIEPHTPNPGDAA